MPSYQGKGEIKFTTLQNSSVKDMAGALNISTEVQKEKFETQNITRMILI